MQQRQDLAAVSLQFGNFGKPTRLDLDLRDGLQKLRRAQRPSLRVLGRAPARRRGVAMP